jgi:hypothetical protein
MYLAKATLGVSNSNWGAQTIQGDAGVVPRPSGLQGWRVDKKYRQEVTFV